MLDGVSLFVFITHLHCTQSSLSLYILTNTFDHIHLLTSASGIQGQLPVANAPAAPHLDIHNGTFDQRREALHARFAQARALRAATSRNRGPTGGGGGRSSSGRGGGRGRGGRHAAGMNAPIQDLSRQLLAYQDDGNEEPTNRYPGINRNPRNVDQIDIIDLMQQQMGAGINSMVSLANAYAPPRPSPEEQLERRLGSAWKRRLSTIDTIVNYYYVPLSTYYTAVTYFYVPLHT